MNIDRIQVKGLFDLFDHDLAFRADERIMILTGPNGFGKTTTLRIIDALFNQAFERLARMRFREVEVSFDDGTTLTATRDTEGQGEDPARLPLRITCQRDGERETSWARRTRGDPRERRMRTYGSDHPLGGLPGVAERAWRYNSGEDALDSDDARTWAGLFSDLPPARFALADRVQGIVDSVTVHFIDTERLTGTPQSAWHRLVMTGSSPKASDRGSRRTVTRYSNELGRRIEQSISKYGKLSQSLDRTFPSRLVTERRHVGTSVASLREGLDAIERKRIQLEGVGLLSRDQHPIEIPDVSQVDESQRGVLAMYTGDVHEKLAVFDDLYSRVSTFTRIANSRFRHKQVSVSSDGLRVVRDDGTTLDLEKLSSGEQHELVLLYEFLFRASENSLILIDEPELSLHVAWQQQWLNDLEETARLSGFRAIVATHSPDIIGRRWSLAVELKGPDEH